MSENDGKRLRELAKVEEEAQECGLGGDRCLTCGNPIPGANRLIVIGVKWYEPCPECGMYPDAEPDSPMAFTKIVELDDPLPGQPGYDG